MNSLARSASHFEELDEKHFKIILGEILKLPIKKRLYLKDIKNDIEVTPFDVGVGVSQVLPVVIGVIAPNSNGKTPSILTIEQPELHIHPAVQCALEIYLFEKN
jgi:predicted ATPase